MENKPLLFRASKVGLLINKSEGLTKKQSEQLVAFRNKGKENLTDKQVIEFGKLLEKEQEAQNCKLSETAKSFIKEMWLEQKHGYVKPLLTNSIMKGRLMEQEAFSLVQKALGGEMRIAYRNTLEQKDLKYLSNEHVRGCPDIVLQKDDYVEDTKVCENIETFMASESSILYEYQLLSYMALTGKTKARLIYCLLKTPEHIVQSEQMKYFYMLGCDYDNKDYVEISEQIEKNNNLIDSIDIKDRVKVFEFEYSQEKIDLLYRKIEKAREFYNSLSLKNN